MIRCGGIKTPAGLRTTADVETCLQHGPRDRAMLYERPLRAWGEDMAEFDAKRTEAETVAKIILQVLNARTPKRRYSIGHMAGGSPGIAAAAAGRLDLEQAVLRESESYRL